MEPDQTPDFRRLSRDISRLMIVDRRPLGRRLAQLRRLVGAGEPFAEVWADLRGRMARSRETVEKRRASLPAPRYPLPLPVVARKEEIGAMIRRHQVVVLCGETGSGKTTQLPKICLEQGRGVAGLLGVTQPRRIAARSIASYISRDLDSELGRAVAYKMRFADLVQAETHIKIMTDGILLAETRSDRLLEQYDTLIIDEAHERSLNIDFLLGYLKNMLPRRPDLKLIISSATLDTEKFSRHFNDAPVVEVSGRAHPVEVRYRPLVSDDPATADDDPDGVAEQALEEGILAAVEELFRLEGGGDALVFLPGEREIRETATLFAKAAWPGVSILPLFARLSSTDQDRVFQPGPKRRVVLATNVAETAITVPGIRFVVDSGLARVSRHSGRTQVRRLPVEKIPRAAADQRKGRCGRLGPGICVRLYSEADFEARPRYGDPEIRRTSLASVILQMKSLNLGDVAAFPFIDPPADHAIRDGVRLLEELGALDSRGGLTEVGRQLAHLPLEPRLARMILAAREWLCLKEILIIASALSIPDPRERPEAFRGKADTVHRQHLDPESDFVGLLNLWRFIERGRLEAASKNGFRRFLKSSYLSFVRVREWRDIHHQLLRLVKELGLVPNTLAPEYAQIHKAVLAGMLGNVGFKAERHEYLGARQSLFFINPGSALFRKSPTWLVAGELVETTRLFARTCARVEPEWVEEVAGPLCRKNHFEAHWEKKAGQVMAWERVTLFGLTLIPRRKVPFGPIDPEAARTIFIQSALVAGEMHSDADFFTHNQALLAELRQLEHKSRRRDLLVDEAEIFAFYDRLVPPRTHSVRHFHNWYRGARKENPRLLHLSRSDLLRGGPGGISGEQFPGHLLVDGREYGLEYLFNPGAGADGISVRIPLPDLNRVSPYPFEWLVPGLLEEKIGALLKALPKSHRRLLVPLPGSVAACMEALAAEGEAVRQQPVCSVLGRILHQRLGVTVPVSAWNMAALPDHLRMLFLVTDVQSGAVLARDRDLKGITAQLGREAQVSFQQIPKGDFERKGLTRWDFDPLPEQVSLSSGGQTLFGCPALRDDGDSVALKLVDDPEEARRMHRRGVARLFALALPQQMKQLKNSLAIGREMALSHAPLGNRESLLREILTLALLRVFLPEGEREVRDAATFQARLQSGRGRLVATATGVRDLVAAILAEYQPILATLKGSGSPALKGVAGEIREQLDALVHPGFLLETPEAWLKHFPRYLKAIRLRLERRQQAPMKDDARAAEIAPLLAAYRGLAARNAAERLHDPELVRYRWLLEEYRVSLFAQELRTIEPVSAKRLEKQWAKILK